MLLIIGHQNPLRKSTSHSTVIDSRSFKIKGHGTIAVINDIKHRDPVNIQIKTAKTPNQTFTNYGKKPQLKVF